MTTFKWCTDAGNHNYALGLALPQASVSMRWRHSSHRKQRKQESPPAWPLPQRSITSVLPLSPQKDLTPRTGLWTGSVAGVGDTLLERTLGQSEGLNLPVKGPTTRGRFPLSFLPPFELKNKLNKLPFIVLCTHAVTKRIFPESGFYCDSSPRPVKIDTRSWPSKCFSYFVLD